MNIRRKKSMSPGEMEASVAEMFLSFIKDVTGKGPSDIKVFILEDMILARMKGVLTRGEKFLIAEDHFADTVERVKRNKTGVFESGRAIIENGVRKITGNKLRSFHIDISTTQDEMVIVMAMETRK